MGDRSYDGSWALDGLMPAGELKARLDIEDDLPDEDRGRYNTLAGLLMAVSGELPEVGERIECADGNSKSLRWRVNASTRCFARNILPA